MRRALESFSYSSDQNKTQSKWNTSWVSKSWIFFGLKKRSIFKNINHNFGIEIKISASTNYWNNLVVFIYLKFWSNRIWKKKNCKLYILWLLFETEEVWYIFGAAANFRWVLNEAHRWVSIFFARISIQIENCTANSTSIQVYQTILIKCVFIWII